MQKPNDFETAQGFTDYKPLPPGGYICKVMSVQETLSQQTAKKMLVISLDIAEGEYAGYFADSYRADTREQKKWGCRVFQLVYDDNGNTSKGFKTFVTSLRESNKGFEPMWGDDLKAFENSFKGKLIGGVFRKEEYEKSDKSGTSWATKCCGFRSIDTIRKGIETPADKPLATKTTVSAPQWGGFMPGAVDPLTGVQIPEDDLPF